MMSNHEVNWENTIVFSPSPRSSISQSNSMTFRIFAEDGPTRLTSDLRRCCRSIWALQSAQVPLLAVEGGSLNKS